MPDVAQAWEELSGQETDIVWERFHAEFLFRPDYYERRIPAIKEPTPSVVLDLSQELSNATHDQLSEHLLRAFRTLAVQGHRRLYALDWQHQCYAYYPARCDGKRPLPWFPDGDYYILLATDFSFGTFGHPWQQSVCVFGERLLNVLPGDFWELIPIQRRNE